MTARLLMQALLRDAQSTGDSSYAQFRSEVNDLRKFVVLNYIAVIKAFKKRNRHLQVTHAQNDTCNSKSSLEVTPCHGALLRLQLLSMPPCLLCSNAGCFLPANPASSGSRATTSCCTITAKLCGSAASTCRPLQTHCCARDTGCEGIRACIPFAHPLSLAKEMRKG